jgi:drug/metabolite transporter (DMT)-like permease
MSDNLKGILAILLSACGFVINDAMVKLATDELPTGEIIFIRGVMATAILGAAATFASAWRSPVVLLQPAMTIRLLTSAGATMFIVAALRHLPLATTSAILQLTPLIVTAGAAILLRAHVGWRRWLASLTGFGGVLLIVKPGGQGFIPEVWIALTALVFTATRDLTTRYYFGIVAMRVGEIPVVAPFRYSLILLALLLSWVIWGHIPDALSMTGIALICLAGLYLLHRERMSRPVAAAAALAKAKTA